MSHGNTHSEYSNSTDLVDPLRRLRLTKPVVAEQYRPRSRPEATSPDVILLIEDEPHIRLTVRIALGEVTTRVNEASNGADGVEAARSGQPDLVVLDLGLPDIDGLEVCRQIRAYSSVPIIVLSARHSEHEKIALFDAGADDYVTKPFSVREFVARAKAHIRRSKTLAANDDAIEPIRLGGLILDVMARKAVRDGVQIHLTPIEWHILATLARAAGRTLTHQQIFDVVWGRQFGSPQQYLRVHITNLRRKIEAHPGEPQLVITEPGIGYRVEVPD